MEMHLQRLIPEFILLGFATALLVIDLFMLRGSSRRIFAFLGIIGTIVTGAALIYQDHGTALAGLFMQDAVSIFFKWLFVIIIAAILYMAYLYEDKIRAWRGEFYSLILFSGVAMFFLSSTYDFVGFYVSLELLAVCQYILAAYTVDRRSTVEGGLKYLVTGALSSGVLLYGISFIYGATGATGFAEVAAVLQTAESTTFVVIGISLVIIGLTFKISSIPFHVWAPDVYQSAPTPVTALLAAGSKAAGFIVMMRILFTALGGVHAEWVTLVVIISGATLLFGNLAAMHGGAGTSPLNALFTELATKFKLFVDVLSEVSERCRLTTSTDILRVYERWIRTKSVRTERMLRELGIEPHDVGTRAVH